MFYSIWKGDTDEYIFIYTIVHRIAIQQVLTAMRNECTDCPTAFNESCRHTVTRQSPSKTTVFSTDLVPTTPDWPAWAGFMVTTHFDLVSGPFHSPIFIGLHSVSTSANMYHLNTRAGELPRSASSHFDIVYNVKHTRVKISGEKASKLRASGWLSAFHFLSA